MNPSNNNLEGSDPKITLNSRGGKLPGLKFNFQPPPSIARKLANNEPISLPNNQSRVRTFSNQDNNKSVEELLANIQPCDVAKRLNFSHLKEFNDSSDKSNSKSEDKMEVDQDDVIDLSHCIIPPEERARLLKMAEERKKEMEHLKENIPKDMFAVPPVNEMQKLNIATRSKSPPRPRLPCLVDDYEYCVEERVKLLDAYEEKLKNRKISGLAQFLSFEIPELPTPKIDFQLYPSSLDHIKVFQFDTPTPDEVYLANLEKNKEKRKKAMFLMP